MTTRVVVVPRTSEVKVVYTTSWKLIPFFHSRPFVPLDEHERVVAMLERKIAKLKGEGV